MQCARCGETRRGYTHVDSFNEDAGTICRECIYRPLPTTTRKLNNSSRLTGLELEFMSPGRAAIPGIERFGFVKPDGSVRDSRGCGKEFNSYPGSGDAILECIKGVTELMREHGCWVNTSCGVHVHLEVKQETEEARRNLRKWWSIFEFIIMGMVNASRWNNHFCVKYGDEVTQMRNHRYKALNIDAMTRFGTFEVRLHHGSIDSGELCSWVIFLTTFFDTFLRVECTKEMEMEVLSMSLRNQVAFLMGQTKMSMFLRKNILAALKRNKYPEAIKAITKSWGHEAVPTQVPQGEDPSPPATATTGARQALQDTFDILTTQQAVQSHISTADFSYRYIWRPNAATPSQLGSISSTSARTEQEDV